jgi:RNA-directed DNA polymerase
MKRSRLTLDDIADWGTLADAFGRAARGKRGRADVEAFRANLDVELGALRSAILAGDPEHGAMRQFSIRDPKPRIIHAPCFRARVMQHALIAHIGPVLEKSLVFDTYACRKGKGALAAVMRVQSHAKHFACYAQIDIAQYFPSVDHQVLMAQLTTKLSDHDLLHYISRIIDAHQDGPARGLPIGALTSQCFANFYLARADRLILEHPLTQGYVRYMDDFIWWGRDRASVRAVLGDVVGFLSDTLKLTVKTPYHIGRSRDGIAFCGYRIFGDRLLLSRRRKRSYQVKRRALEIAFSRGEIRSGDLQRAMDAVLAITAHADALIWRANEMRRHPLALALAQT